MNPATRPTLRRLVFAFLFCALLLLLWWQGERQRTPKLPAEATAGAGSGAEQGAARSTAAPVPIPGVGAVAAAGAPAAGESAAARAERRRMAEERLATYRKFAQYPPGSRPARENADQLYPNAPVVRGIPLSIAGRPSEHILLKLRQDRLVVVGSESIELGIRCEDSQAQPVPCTVESAQIAALPLSGKPGGGPLPVEFAPDSRRGQGGEQVATLRPASLGLVATSWPLRVDVKIRAGHDPVERGAALFDFLFTPDPPAVSTGPVRESVERGSLLLSYPLLVARAGRYLLHARVDDADGKPVAYLEFNDLLATGPQQVPLWVFGKLILDEKPRFPLQVRDLDGFLLKEDADPDREQIPPRTGYHHTTQIYSLSTFSAAEWQSEEKARHEREFEADVEAAR